ncbi:MAG: hypothetical protein R3E68_01355 [Burkholderiaceae bacterium]
MSSNPLSPATLLLEVRERVRHFRVGGGLPGGGHQVGAPSTGRLRVVARRDLGVVGRIAAASRRWAG